MVLMEKFFLFKTLVKTMTVNLIWLKKDTVNRVYVQKVDKFTNDTEENLNLRMTSSHHS